MDMHLQTYWISVQKKMEEDINSDKPKRAETSEK